MSQDGQTPAVRVAPDGAFVPIGVLELATLHELRELVDEAMAPGRVIVLDLSQVTFLDSSAIHWLVETCDATDHPVVLRDPPPVVRRVLDDVLTVDSDGDAWVYESRSGRPTGE